MEYKKILVTMQLGIGDVILTTPVLKALKEKFPDSHLAVLVYPHSVDILTGLPFVDEIIPFDKKTHSLWSVIRRIWRFDLAVCLDPRERTAFLAFLAMIPHRAGVEEKRRWMLNHVISQNPHREEQYEPLNFAAVLQRSMGIDLAGYDMETLHVAPPGEEDRKKVDKLLADHGILPGEPFLTLAPFTAWEPKNWPLEYYQELIVWIEEELGWTKLVTIGAPKDRDRAATLAGPANLTGLTTMPQMGEILRRSSFLISSCSSQIHVAAAKNTPMLVLYGPGSPKRWAPRKNCTVMYAGLECSPCDSRVSSCPEKRCMYALTVEQVFEKLREVLPPKQKGMTHG